MQRIITVITALLLGLVLIVGCTASQESEQQELLEDDYNDVAEDSDLEQEKTPDDDTKSQPDDRDPDDDSTSQPDDRDPVDDQEPSLSGGELEVHFIDVGQGDSILIQTTSKNILIDGGNRGNIALNYLNNRGIETLDLVIGTHPHADHIGGLINVMEAIPVREVIDPGVVHTTKTFEDYLTLIDEKNIKFSEGRAGMTRDLGGGAAMQIIHPSSPSSSHLNNASIVARVTFGQISFLFTGDAEAEAESQILNRGYTLDSTILKVGHHGSRTSTTAAFLSAVGPDAGVIMCGTGNTYGHPHKETLHKLHSAGVNIYRTDIQGNIIITTDGKTYSVSDEPHSYQEQQQPPPSQPGTDPAPEPDPGSDPEGRVNINTATLDELQDIVHIGPARAQAIIDLRPFSSLDDLTRVSGIGPARLQDIKDQGVAYVQ